MSYDTSPEKLVKSAREELREVRAALKLEKMQAELATVKRHRQHLQESNIFWDWLGGYGDLLKRLRGDDGILTFAPSTAADRLYGANWPFWRTWQEHAFLRASARLLTTTSAIGTGALEGLTAYVIGEGYTYRAVPKGKQQPSSSLVDAVQSAIDTITERNDLSSLEQELFRRSRRDGEYFLRYFQDEHDGWPILRTVEPEQVIEAFNLGPYDIWNASFGIINDRNDLQTVKGFLVSYSGIVGDAEEVDRSEMDHVKINVDRLVKRGLSDFVYDTGDLTKSAGRLLENMAEGSAIQASIALIRQHEKADSSSITAFNSSNESYKQPDFWTGAQQSVQQYNSGRIEDIPKGMEYVPPPYAAGAQYHSAVAELVIRTLAVKWNAPAWLVGGDAGNTSYASSVTAESPFVKRCKAWQGFYGVRFKRALQRSLRMAADEGLIRADGRSWSWDEISRLVDLHCEPPSVETRNRLAEAQTNQIEIGAGYKSRQLCAQEQGYDWDKIEQDNEEYDERHGSQGLSLDLPSMDDSDAATGPSSKPANLPTSKQPGEEKKSPGLNEEVERRGDQLLNLPDIRQKDHYSCGACASMAVGRFFGVGPETLEEWKTALGTNVEKSTSPQAIVSYLRKLGLKVEARSSMTIDDLRQAWQAGCPVICPVQDYGPFITDQARWPYGHYLAVIGVGMGDHVFCQDSSADNVTKGSDTIADKGRVMVAPDVWMKNWHDRDEHGNKYIRFGIIVGKP